MKQPLCDAMRDTSQNPPPSEENLAEPGQNTANQRIFRRYALTVPVLVCPLLPDAGLTHPRRARRTTALVTNISLSGLTFLSPVAYLPGTRLQVQIVLGAQTYLIEVVARRGQYVTLPGRRAWQCAAQILRGEEAVRFIPRLARYLYAHGTRE